MFDNYFDVFLADTEEGKKEHFKLRYKVYCEEMGFEDKDKFPLGQETDQWDDHSVHFIVRHRETGQWVGAMRLVIQQNGNLPFSELSQPNCNIVGNNIAVETSRLCLVQDIRRRKIDADKTNGMPSSSAPSAFLNRGHINRTLIWGLFRAASLYCQQYNYEDWYTLCTKAFARIVKREGFLIDQIGDVCIHRGERFPYRLQLNDILANPLWENDYKIGYKLYSEIDSENFEDFEQVA